VTTPREAAVGWMRQQLAAALGVSAEEPEIGERAENFVALVEHYGLKAEEFFVWIQTPRISNEWSLAEARSWCESMVAAQRDLAAMNGQLLLNGESDTPAPAPWQPARCGHCAVWLETEDDAARHLCEMLCPRCFARSAQRLNGHWVCTDCGELE
jgi:hypothetical protein